MPGPLPSHRRAGPAVLALLLLAAASPAAAQEAALVEAVAPLLAAEDAREWVPAVFSAGLDAPEPLVRRTAALAVGRVGDLRGTALLRPLLLDPDSTVQATAFFALGLLRDTAAVPLIADRLTGLPALGGDAAAEAVTALAKIGGPTAADLVAGILSGATPLTVTDRSAPVQQAALEAWRLGAAAPVTGLLAAGRDPEAGLRWKAVFSLARLREPAAGDLLLTSLRDGEAIVRQFAARALTRDYAERSGLGAPAVIEGLTRALYDEHAGVRVNALRALGSFGRPDLSERITGLLTDPAPNVQVQAVVGLGESGGPDAVRELRRLAEDERKPYALGWAALLWLARRDSAAFVAAAARWSRSADWRDRSAAAEGWARVAPDPAPNRPDFLMDRDPRVVAAALGAWARARSGPDTLLVRAARRSLTHPDAVVRTHAANVLARAPAEADVPALREAFRRAERDSFPDAALAALTALEAVARSTPAGRAAVVSGFLGVVPRPADYQIRRWAEERWPEASRAWGPAFPIRTGRTLQDYRGVARRYVVNPQSPDAYPRVTVETDGRGSFELQLFGPEAPLTVANFLDLVDRRFFDGNRWHRVVPNFVVQDGDPRGDGSGGPGGAIRDEINRRRYGDYVLGMALSGPDTGGSQWFITLSPQPHLDGTYTVFGKVVGTTVALQRIVQGDLIRSIRR